MCSPALGRPCRWFTISPELHFTYWYEPQNYVPKLQNIPQVIVHKLQLV